LKWVIGLYRHIKVHTLNFDSLNGWQSKSQLMCCHCNYIVISDGRKLYKKVRFVRLIIKNYQMVQSSYVGKKRENRTR
jgi:hypothetical protein